MGKTLSTHPPKTALKTHHLDQPPCSSFLLQPSLAPLPRVWISPSIEKSRCRYEPPLRHLGPRKSRRLARLFLLHPLCRSLDLGQSEILNPQTPAKPPRWQRSSTVSDPPTVTPFPGIHLDHLDRDQRSGLEVTSSVGILLKSP